MQILQGLITDIDLPAAEEEWPGIEAFLQCLPREEKPLTFLELVWRFERNVAAPRAH